MNRGDVNMAMKLLDEIAAQNPTHVTETIAGNGDKSGIVEKPLLINADVNGVEKPKENIHYTVLDLFRHKSILKTSAITWYIWYVQLTFE